MIKDKAHFFGNIERVWINEGRTIQIPPRPDLNWATVTQVRAWNALAALRPPDQRQPQLVGALARRVVAANRPDQQPGGDARRGASGSGTSTSTRNVAFNSVLGRNIVNQFRFGWTREDDRFAQNDFSACPSGGFDACSDQNLLEQQNVGANISYLTFLDGPRNVGTHWITNSPEISETLSWFIPDKKGDHDLKFGAKYYFTEWRFQNHAQINGQFVIPSNGPFNAADPRTYPERLTIQVPADFRVLMKQRAWAIFAQDKWRREPEPDLQPRAALRPRVHAARQLGQPLLRRRADDYPVDKQQHLAAGRRDLHLGRRAGRCSARAGACSTTRSTSAWSQDFVRNGINSNSFVAQFPARPHRSRAARRAVADQPDAGQRPGGQPRAAQPALSRRARRSRNTGVVWLDQPGRHMPSIQQVSLGYQRQLGTRTSVSADYVHTYGRGLFMQREPQPRRPDHHRRPDADRPRRTRSSSPTSTPAPTSASTTTTG